MAIEAQYRGECPICEHWWSIGDRIEAGPDGWQHVTCLPFNGKPIHPVCQTCWLTHPIGECDRD
jgi:hypothetical protein